MAITPSRSLLVRGLFSNYVGIFFAIAVAFVMSPYLVHTLGDSAYGVWTILSALTGYLLVLDLGISSAIIKYAAKYRALDDKEALSEFVSSALIVYIGVALFIVVFTPVLIHFLIRYIDFDDSLSHLMPLLVFLTAVNVVFTCFRGLFEGIYMGLQRQDIQIALRVLQLLTNSVLIYLVLEQGIGLVGMSWAALGTQVFFLGIAAFILYRQYPEIKIRLSKAKFATAKTAINFGKFTFLSMLANQMVFYTDAFIIGIFLSAAAVTYYTIAATLAEYSQLLVLGICSSFLPYFSGIQASSDKEDLYNAYVMSTKLAIGITCLLCVGIFVLGYSFLEIWMGKKYADISTPILLILISIQLVKGPQTISYSLLQSVGAHKIYSYWQAFFAIANLVLSIWLVQRSGIIGVAIATAITQITFNGLVVPILTFRYLKIDGIDYLKRTYIAALFPASILALVLYLLLDWRTPGGYLMLLTQAGIASAIYAVIYFFLVLGQTERRFVLSKIPSRLGGTG